MCIDIDLDKCKDIAKIVLCFIVVVGLLGICIVYGKKIIKCVKNLFYGNFYFIKSIFQGFISTMTTMLAFKPILSKDIFWYAVTFGVLYFFITIFSFKLEDAKRDITLIEFFIVVIVGLVCIWLAYLIFDTNNFCKITK